MVTKTKELSLESLSNEVAALRKENAATKNRILNLSAILNKTADRLSMIDPNSIEKELSLLRPRVRSVNSIIQAMVNKTTVITETCYFVRTSKPDLYERFCSICIWAFDALPDEWWKEQTRTIGEWTDLLVEAWTKRDDTDFEAFVALLGHPVKEG